LQRCAGALSTKRNMVVKPWLTAMDNGRHTAPREPGAGGTSRAVGLHTPAAFCRGHAPDQRNTNE
jgi:hypothetical protein